MDYFCVVVVDVNKTKIRKKSDAEGKRVVIGSNGKLNRHVIYEFEFESFQDLKL